MQRYFQLFGLQPHRSEGFKLSNDPFFVEKLRDVVGLYLSPPENALVLCVDEKSQCRALERTQPMLPMGFGYVEGVTHDYKRRGTTTLFAALNVLNGAGAGNVQAVWAEALDLAGKVKAIEPDSPVPYRVLAFHDLNTGDVEGARIAAETFTRLKPRTPDPFNVVGNVYQGLCEPAKAFDSQRLQASGAVTIADWGPRP